MTDLAQLPDNGPQVREEALPPIQWYRTKSGTWLQQLYRVTTIENHIVTNVRDEWRNIPVVKTEDADGK